MNFQCCFCYLRFSAILFVIMSDSYNLVYYNKEDCLEYDNQAAWQSCHIGLCMLFRRVLRLKKIWLLLVLLVLVITTLSKNGVYETTHQIAQYMPELPVWNISITNGLYKKPAGQLCSQLAIPDSYWYTDNITAFVDIPNLERINVGMSVCVRVVVPANLSSLSMVYMPIPEMPWDSVLLDMTGNQTGISIPVQLQIVPHVNNYRKNQAHVYQADVILRDADIYRPTGYIEYRDAKWNAEGESTLPLFEPEELYIDEQLQVVVTDTRDTSLYSLHNYLELPLCTDMDMDGRWIHVDDLPFNASLVPKADNFNRVWLPYTCRLQRYEYPEFAQCLVDKHPMLHWYGDSNTRRALKKITSLGEWCSQPTEQNERHCLCEDYLEPFDRFNEHAREVLIDVDPVEGGKMPFRRFHPTKASANKSRIVAFKWDGLTLLNTPDWNERFDLDIELRFGKPQTAIISLGNWDPAFMTLQNFAIEAEKLVKYIEASYSEQTSLIIRTGQYFCCSADPTSWQRKYSRLRNAYFSKYVVDLFYDRLSKSRDIKVWDVARIAEHRPYQARTESTSCPSNHVRAEVVEVENQILFNSLCN